MLLPLQLVGDPELLEVHLTQGGGEDRFAVIRQKLERGWSGNFPPRLWGFANGNLPCSPF